MLTAFAMFPSDRVENARRIIDTKLEVARGV